MLLEILFENVSIDKFKADLKKDLYLTFTKTRPQLKFEDLTTNPEKELKRIYNYLELPYYNHDFNNVEQMTIENDVIHGIFGDHKIERQIRPVKENYNEILGKENADRLRTHYDWFYKRFNYV